MADRHVKVTLSANVRDYTRSVQNAANETDQLRRSAERFDGKTYRAHLDVKIDKAALAQMALLQGQLGRFDGKTYRARVDVDRKSLDDLLSHLTLVDTSIARVARSWRGFAFTGLAALSPQMSSLAHAAVQAAGALGLLPAVGFAAAGGIGAVAIGVMGMKDALKNLGEDPKKFAELVKDLAPSARQTAIELNNLSGKWKELQLHVQQELFEGVSQRVDKLGTVYLPVLKNALGGIASEMGNAANAFMDFAAKAETVKDAKDGLENIRQAASSIAPVMVNLSQIFRDVAVVGSTFLPQIGHALEDVTARWRDMVATARETGQLADIIQAGMERVRQFGAVIRDTAGMLTGVFRAADVAGFDFLTTLERLTRQGHEFVDSVRGQQQVAAFFQGLGAVIRSITPAFRELAGMAIDVIRTLSQTGTLVAAGEAFSSLAAAARPVVVALAELAGSILPPLLRALQSLSPLLGPVVAGFLALRAASGVATAIAGVGAAMSAAAINAGVFTERLTGSAVAGERVMTTTDRMGRALNGIGRALPVVGAAVIGLAWAYEEFGSKADEAAAKVVQGAITIEQAIEAEIAQVEKNTLFWITATQQQNAHAAARQRVTEEFRRQYEALTPLQRAQADVAIAQERFNQLLLTAGMRSQETRNALEDLRAKSKELEIQQIMVAQGVDRATAAMLYQRDAAREATNADLALERATINLEYAQQRATEATREHGASSLQARDANLNLREATLRVAEAAGEKALKDAEATGASNGAQRAAEAQRLKYLELAANTKDPLRTELLQLADQLRTLPDGNFTVTGTGKTSFSFSSTGEVTGGPPGVPITGRASGGVLPGWSPGKDIHQFYSPTGGILRLSGGEAVMRPEFTRAVGTGWVDAVNRAARVGGTSGVARALTGGESNNGTPTQAFANGGVFINGMQPLRRVAKDGDGLDTQGNWNRTTKHIIDELAPKIAAQVKMFEEGWFYGGGAGAGDALAWARSQAGKPYIWGGVGPRGYDCSGFMSAIMNVMDGRNPHSRRGSTATMPWSGMRPGFGPGLSVGNTKNAGGGIGHMAGTLNGVNVESRGGRGVLVGPAARGARHSLFNSIYHYVGRGRPAAPGSAGRGDAGIGGSGVQRWAGVVSQALAIMGQPQSYLGITLRRMNQESSGRVNIVNTWDINARRGTPSVGLMQVIRPTYAAYKHPAYDRGPYIHGVSIDPLANILASMRYALARYGSLPRAYNRPGGYDEGGLAMGKGLLAKYTVAPERVLSPRQTVAFERLVPIAEALARGNTTAGTTVIKNYNLTVQNAGNSTVDLQAQFKRLEMMSGV